MRPNEVVQAVPYGVLRRLILRELWNNPRNTDEYKCDCRGDNQHPPPTPAAVEGSMIFCAESTRESANDTVGRATSCTVYVGDGG